MPTKATIASAVCFACLRGTALGAQDLALFDLAEGAGGYTGVIDLLERPVSLAWRPCAGSSAPQKLRAPYKAAKANRSSSHLPVRSPMIEPRVKRRFVVSELAAN
jgi:hypothetical protein